MPDPPALSVVVPTFNNERVLRRAVESWRAFGGPDVELIVIEDGCRDGTQGFLREVADTPWGRAHLRWAHDDDAHELRCTNRGMTLARGELVAAFQDDMFLHASWFVPELIATFRAYSDLGLLSLSRGLDCIPCSDPLERWEDLWDWKRLRSTIGPAPRNWVLVQEVDAVIRPWVVRRACLDAVGLLDEAFRPTEWDEADLAFRIRRAGWKVATCGFERLGAYVHLGSTTLGRPTSEYLECVLRNGRLFHERWDADIEAHHNRPRATWRRRATIGGWMATGAQAARYAWRRIARRSQKSEFRSQKSEGRSRNSEGGIQKV